ncbi:MAG: helix-turn-helix domain-containing protein [gamma proteobacterium endosymbiont of Lamellibrachia anaximandri]|nr:helix-turn-helix domain-containing protein [gamma proteobacterium endosymbiont of Lamellibrachia anaximandri]MBL3533602.1 helix-turn-helix domain-containing protein [gamma proteobacterium endosymbiont of Lamellibrachia anaximandri]
MSVLTNSEAESEEAVEPIEGPGARLRKTRQSLGLDQSKVAAQLHLSEGTIEALEWDDFDTLPGAVFVQGYLRNYARLLKLPEGEILEAFLALSPAQQSHGFPHGKVATVGKEVRSSHGAVRMMTWLIVISLLALLGIWWQGQLDLRLGGDPVDTPVEVAPVIESLPEMQNDTDVLTLSPLPAQEDQAPVESQEVVTASLEEGAPSEAEVAESEAVVVADQAVVQDSIPIPLEESEADAVASVDEPPPAPVEIPAPAPAAPKVVFEFSERCWAEVRDANGKARIFGEIAAGTTRLLDKGPAPYTVVLGNASGVSITVDGVAYGLKRHARANVARFSFDPSNL